MAPATPVIYKDRVYVPLSASEINVGADEKHECCKTHGAVFALDALTGKLIWATHTMEDAKPHPRSRRRAADVGAFGRADLEFAVDR